MDILILRHGEAQSREEAAAWSVSDPERALTAKGERDVAVVAKLAKKAGISPGIILTSPFVRAYQTAVIAAQELCGPKPVETDSLVPSASPEQLWKEIGKQKSLKSVMVVGHEPHLSYLAEFLLEAEVGIAIKKGSLIRITTQSGLSPGGILRWMITPRLARAVPQNKPE